MIKSIILVPILFLTYHTSYADDNDIGAGKALAIDCKSCHGGRGLGKHDSVIPSLAGQQKKYLVKQLMDFKANKRQDAVMSPIAQNLTISDIEKLAVYYSAQREAYCW